MRRSIWQDTPDAFSDDPGCQQLRQRLRDEKLDNAQLIDLIEWARDDMNGGPDLVLIAVILDLLPTVGEEPWLRDLYIGLVAFGPRGSAPPVRPHALRALRVLADAAPPMLSDLVFAMPPMWAEDHVVAPIAAGLVARLLAAGDTIDESRTPPKIYGEAEASYVQTLDRLADRIGPAASALVPIASRLALRAEFGSVLRFPTLDDLRDPHLHLTPALDALATEIVGAIARTPAGSVVVAGDPGSGRSTLIRLAASRLVDEGWLIVEATPDELAAGQVYVNQMEGRIQQLAAACAGRKVLLVMPQFESAITSGRWSGDPRSLADRLVGPVGRGSPPILAEIPSEALESLPRECAPLARLLFATRPPRYPDDALIEIGRAAVSRADAPSPTAATLGAALQLARHMLSNLALPGSLTRLLTAAAERTRDDATTIEPTDLYAGLSRITGMPRAVLDDAVRLDLAEVRGWFGSRVLGQHEAVDALVARIALVKAGLTDPNRPYGTLLFVGPTGTGKTEIARALAEYLFGSPDRLVRIDMSELKTFDSLVRLTGTSDFRGRRSLASEIRAEPFSVVLLDEFEKATSEAWDVFLQVFDAGRLTDQAGRTVDFRQTIVIVTSNLGSAVPAARGLGFSDAGGGGFSADRVLRAVRDTLRPELINRFDRVVVFRPLPRDVMRSIVHHEIEAVLGRRGIAHRDWAVEVDEGAVDFLLDRGFTIDLGARPLRRAVERYLLAPLAETIVSHEAPRGAQFLFVTAGAHELDVQFVAGEQAVAAPGPARPDEADDTAPAPAPTPAPEPIALDPLGTRAELRALRDALVPLRDQVRTDAWDERKTALLLQMSEPDFWDRPGRFVVLGDAEIMDRTEARLRGASSLLDRLFRLAPDDTARIQREPVGRLARELVQLGHALTTIAAGGAQDALMLVEADEGGTAFAGDLVAMYEAWAKAAGAVCRLLERGDDRFRRVLLFEGLGAHRALAGETGIHVLERGGGRGARRVGTVHVAIEAWSAMPDDDAADYAGHLARADEERIVRRYQREPTPLVRDGVRKYRTGRLDRVLAGGFDLF